MKKLSILLASLLYADTYTDGLTYLNKVRVDTGLNQLVQNSFLDSSSQGHGNYLIQNNIAGHYQDSSHPYFTGVSPTDRGYASGYKYSISENISFGSGSYVASIDNLMSAIYHRFGFLDFNIDEVGFAKEESENYYYKDVYVYNMGNSNLNSICSDGGDFSGTGAYFYGICEDSSIKIDPKSVDVLKALNPNHVIYPVENQLDFPPVFYEESPDPLPDLEVSGNPISMKFNDYFINSVNLESFKLYDSENALIETRLLDENSDPNSKFSNLEFALFPLKRLDWNKYYRAEFNGAVNGENFSKSWQFKTRGLDYPVLRLESNNQSFGVEANKQYAVSVSQNLINKFNSYSSSFFGTCNASFIDFNTLLVDSSKKCTITLDGKIAFSIDTSLALSNTEDLSSNPINNTPVENLENNDTELPPETPTIESFTLNISKGWNLISIPVDNKVVKKESFGEKTVIFKYQESSWSNPDEVESGIGFWLLSNSENSLSFEGEKYSFDTAKISENWQLLGASDDIESEKLSDTHYWTYDKEWSYKPEIINQGQGFWIIKR